MRLRVLHKFYASSLAFRTILLSSIHLNFCWRIIRNQTFVRVHEAWFFLSSSALGSSSAHVVFRLLIGVHDIQLHSKLRNLSTLFITPGLEGQMLLIKFIMGFQHSLDPPFIMFEALLVIFYLAYFISSAVIRLQLFIQVAFLSRMLEHADCTILIMRYNLKCCFIVRP